MLGARFPPRGLCSTSEFPVAGWSDGSQDSAQLLLTDVSSGTQTLRLELRNHLCKVLWGQLEGAPAPVRPHWDAEGSATLPGGADLAALGRSSPASLQMFFRTLQIFLYYGLEATTLILHFCDSRRTRGSSETLWGCRWGCGIWC